jgi:hypothetical protein
MAMPKKKQDIPVLAIVEMPAWKAKICDIVVGILFPGEKYFVLTYTDTGFTSNQKGKYTHKKTGIKVDLQD